MEQTSILVHLDEAVQARLSALADARKHPVSDVAADVIATYLAPDSWEHQRIRAGLAELEDGKAVSNERVMEWLGKLAKGERVPRPRP